MLHKRLIGMITVKDGWAVQSIGYRRYLPLGHVECIAENLDRWGADEIVVLCIDRTRRGLGPDLELLRRLATLGLSTPMIYGGGIASVADAAAVIQSGADRLCLDAALRGDLQHVRAMSALLGAQALIGVLPLAVEGNALRWHDHVHRADGEIDPQVLALFADGVLSEALLVDWRNEGKFAAFDQRLVDRFPPGATPLIVFGGLSDAAQPAVLLAEPRVAAIAVGNSLNYREHAVQARKEALPGCTLRPAQYAKTR
jgi:cyclase